AELNRQWRRPINSVEMGPTRPERWADRARVAMSESHVPAQRNARTLCLCGCSCQSGILTISDTYGHFGSPCGMSTWHSHCSYLWPCLDEGFVRGLYTARVRSAPSRKDLRIAMAGGRDPQKPHWTRATLQLQ